MKIKKGDKVIVKTGKDAGKTGVVLRAYPAESKIVIEGLNMVKRAKRSKAGKDKSQIVEMPAKLHVSNVMVVDGKSGSRVGIKKVEGKNVRVAKKSGTELK